MLKICPWGDGEDWPMSFCVGGGGNMKKRKRNRGQTVADRSGLGSDPDPTSQLGPDPELT
jgi:hypothetical protein